MDNIWFLCEECLIYWRIVQDVLSNDARVERSLRFVCKVSLFKNRVVKHILDAWELIVAAENVNLSRQEKQKIEFTPE